MKNLSLSGVNWCFTRKIRTFLALFFSCFFAITGNAQSALLFDGIDDIVSTTTNTGIEDICDDGFTMEAWINPNVTTGVRSIIRKTGDYNFYINAGSLVVELWDDGTTVRRDISGPGGITVGAWTHVAFTWDGTTGLFFVDGVQTAGVVTGPFTTIGVADLNIGDSQSFPGQVFDGSIDEVRIWTCVKSQADILADMSVTHTGAEAGLVLYYDFEDGAGTNLTDLSTNGNDATLTNGPLWVAGIATAGSPSFGGCAPSNNYYWVGGPGNWSDAANHWANASGGVPGSAPVPASGDNAIFDDNSGLALATDVVNIDVALEMDTINYSTMSNPFIFNNAGFDMSIEHSWIGSLSGVSFTGGWGEIIFSSNTAGESITSGGTTFIQDFRINGPQSISLVDNLDLTSGDMFVENGGLITNDNTLSIGSFISSSINNRTIDLGLSTVNVSEGIWTIDGTNLTSTFTGSEILLDDTAGSANFAGGSQDYNIVRSQTATSLEVIGDNNFAILECQPSTSLLIDNGDILACDSLIVSGSCAAPFTISTIIAGVNASISKTGFNILNLSNVAIINIDGLGGATYNVSLSDTINSAGWTLAPTDFYWISDSGDWNSVAQWSNTSGGAISGCIPSSVDRVFFDANSFSAASQTVTVDDTAYCGYIDWSAISLNQNFLLDSSLYIYGDIVLNSNLNVSRGLISSSFIVKDNSQFLQSGALMDCNVTVSMDNNLSSFDMLDNFATTDSASIIQLNGRFSTNGFSLRTGSWISANNPFSSSDQREIDISNSNVEILQEFNALGDTVLNLISTNSELFIGDELGFTNNLITEGKTFNNVTLDFKENSLAQTLRGSNQFNKLRITPGSEIYFQEGATQTINDSLVAKGNCLDSITIHTLDTTSLDVANIDKTGADYILECLNLTGIENTGDQLTTYFSSNIGSNVNWDFDASAPITTSFQPDSTLSSFCFGQLVYFENSSLPLNGTINDLTFEWTTGDGSLPIEELTSTVEANKTNAQFNYAQSPGVSSDALSDITDWTETLDAQGIFTPLAGELNTTPGNENMSFEFTVGYRFSLVNSTGSEAYLVDMNSNADTVEYNYRPEVKILKNGAQFGVASSQFAFPTHTFEEDTLANGVTQIGADTVSFSLVGQNLDPADVLTAQIGADVSYVSFTDEPLWKDGILTTDNDVTVTYRIDVDTIFMRAIPTSPAYEIDSLVHEFETPGDSMIVTLNAIDTRNFCEVKDTFYIDIIKPEPSLLASITDTIVCPKTEIEFEAFSTVDTTQFQFFYNGVAQNTPSSNDTLFSVYPIMQDDTISLQVFQAGCASDTIPYYTYNVYAAPTFTFDNNSTLNEICQNDTVIFTSTSPDSISSFQYLVNNSSVSPILDSLATYSTTTLNNSDLVSVIVIDTNNCQDTTSVTFTVNPLPTTSLIESSGGNVICENEEVTFTAAGAAQYEFYLNDTLVQGPAATTTWMTDSLTVNDTVSVTGLTALGCSLEAPTTFNYIVNPAPVLTLTSSDADNIICSGENVIFTASGAVVYEFFVDGVSVQGPSTVSSYSTSGLTNNQVVSVEGSISGCLGNEPTITMTVNTAPTTSLTNDDDGDNEVCQGTTVVFTASGATNYQFFIDGVSQGAPSTVNTLTSNTIQNGQVIEVVGESNGCTVSANNTFSVLSVPNVNMTSNNATNIICDGDAISFTGSNAADYEFFVNNVSVQGPSTNSVLSNPTFTTGNNDVYVIGTSNNGCSGDSQTIQVQVNAIPTITVVSSDADNTICEGESVTFTASGGDNYQFILNGTPQSSMSSNNTFITSNLSNGQQLIVDGLLSGCESSSNIITTVVNPSPNIAFTSDDVDNIFCADDLVNFTATGAVTYEFFVDGVSQGVPSAVNTINSTGFATGTFNVTVEGESSNCSTTAGLSVTVNALPVISLVSSDADNSICQGETVTYTSNGAALYEFFVNGISQGASNPIPTFNVNSLNDNDIVSVDGFSADGCSTQEVLPAIEVLPIPTITLTSSDVDQQICDGESVTFTGSGATLYEFFINGNSQGPLSTTDNITTTGLMNGDVITLQGEETGCSSASNALSFQVYGFPLVELVNNEDTVLCVDELTDLVANGADEYLFYINGNPVGSFSAVNSFNSILANLDEVSVEGQTNGCSSFASSTIDFSVFNYPTVNAVSSDADLEICLNDTVTFTSTGANEYVYEINGLQIGNDVIGDFDTDAIANGDVFSVIGFNAHCASTPVDFTFVVNEMNLDLTIAPDNMICEGDNVDFTATGADEYEFILNGTSTGAQSSVNTYSNNTLSHFDEVTFFGYNNTTGCRQAYDDFIIMYVLDEPVITPQSSTTFCEGDSVLLVSNSPYGNEWYLNNTPITGANDTLYSADSTGSYTLQVTMGGNGDLWSLGQNATGVFANGTSFNSSVPVASTSLLSFTEVSAGFNFVMGINDNDELFAWGDNATGQLGNGTFTASTEPIQVGALTNVKTVATGSNSTMATINNGDVYVWGNNIDGQLATGNTSVVNFPFLNANLSNVDTIAAGRSHYVVLRNDGTVLTVGNNDYGQLGDGTLLGSTLPLTLSLANIVSVGASEYSSYAVDNTGTLYVWGNNASGQLGLGDLTNRLTPEAADLSNVVSAQGGANHTVFLTDDNKVYTSGGNAYGQLGIGNQNSVTIPTEIDLQGIEMIAAGQYTTLMKRTDNSVFAIGNNTESQLLNVTDTAIVTPTHLSSLEGVTFIESSQNATHVLYGQNTTCVSAPVVTDFLPSPDVNIINDGDTLSTDQPGAVAYQWYFNGNPVLDGNGSTLVATNSGIYSVEVTYASGCTSISGDYNHSMTSVKVENGLNVVIYPNPVRGLLTVSINGGLEIQTLRVIDNIGKVVLSQEVTGGQVQLDCTSLDNGVYYLAVMTNSGETMKRFVVNN